MCGIVGIIGNKSDLVDKLIHGIKRMDYRGYDSSGIAVYDQGQIKCVKAPGRISELEKKLSELKLKGSVGIAHTRWATHGVPNEVNAHPHFSNKHEVYLAHNGVIENYHELKKMLLTEGRVFISDTDTEVIVHLIEKFYEEGLEFTEDGLVFALQKTLALLEGTYGLVIMHRDHPQILLAARHGSPVMIGVGKNEMIIASDQMAIISYTDKVNFLDDGTIAKVYADDYQLIDASDQEVEKAVQKIELDITNLSTNGFETFMLKEIFEQPKTIEDTFRGRIISATGDVKFGGLEEKPRTLEVLRHIKRLNLVACGSAAYAAKVGEYLFEEIAGIPTKVDKATEFAYREPVFDSETAYILVSQSGETMDTLTAMKKIKQKGIMALGVVNAVGSTIARESDAGIYLRVGPEIGVASTKAFTSQVVVMIMLAVMLGRQRHLSETLAKEILREIEFLPEKIKKVLEQNDKIIEIAKRYVNSKSFVYLGRKFNYAVALEGALKLKEIAYVHTEGYPAGELKHGPLALVDKDLPTVFIIPNDSVRNYNISNLQEIKARQGQIIAIATEGDEEISALADEIIYIPKAHEAVTPVLTAIPLQLLAYQMAKLKGCNIDKPRNLAKAVTVA
jgi:glucosamine--fructose-6-phosphate aminotransferase (isomerizing)